MALKKRSKADSSFSMAAMTDFIFLLLIFFMLIATVVVPNTIKVMLPQSAKQENPEKTLTRIVIDKDLNHYISFGKDPEHPVSFEEIEPQLRQAAANDPEMYIILYADEAIPHGEVVKILNIANVNKYRLVIATRPI